MNYNSFYIPTFLRDSELKLMMKEIEMEIAKEGWAHFVLCTVSVCYLLLI